MLAAARLIGFVPARDLGVAKAFYTDTLGLTLASEDEFALMFTLGAAALRVARVESLTPQPFTIAGFEVADIAREVQTLAARGVRFERYPYFEQDALGIWTAPSGAKVAWFRDPDGNTLSVSG